MLWISNAIWSIVDDTEVAILNKGVERRKWFAHLPYKREAVGSNPTSTTISLMGIIMGQCYKCYLKDHSPFHPGLRLYLHYDDDSGELYLVVKSKTPRGAVPKFAVPLPRNQANTVYFMLEGVYANIDIFNEDLPKFGYKPKKSKFNWKPTHSIWD